MKVAAASFAELSVASFAAATTVYMRIEGPTKTIYEQTIQVTTQKTLSNNGHSATCDGAPKVAAGVTSLTALAQTGQYFVADFNGSTFGYVTHINGTSNDANDQWGVLFNNYAANGGLTLQGVDDGTNTEYASFCYETLPDNQHMLYAFFGDIDETDFLILSGPSTAYVGFPVVYNTTSAPAGSWLDDSIVDRTLFPEGALYASLKPATDAHGVAYNTATVTFTEPGVYNMKAHCVEGSPCVRSNRVVTTVSAAPPSTTTTVYMRIEGPTHTIYEQTIHAVTQKTLANNGHSAMCDGAPVVPAGVTTLTALAQTGQSFYTSWNGSIYGYIEHINGTSNNEDQQWGILFNNYNSIGGLVLQGYDNSIYDDVCYQTVPNKQHMLYAFFGDIDSVDFLILSGPATAKVGDSVTYTTTYAPPGSWLNDLSTDATTTGQRVYAELQSKTDASGTEYNTATVTFQAKGTYNMKAHCAANTDCVRSNHVVTVVS